MTPTSAYERPEDIESQRRHTLPTEPTHMNGSRDLNKLNRSPHIHPNHVYDAPMHPNSIGRRRDPEVQELHIQKNIDNKVSESREVGDVGIGPPEPSCCCQCKYHQRTSRLIATGNARKLSLGSLERPRLNLEIKALHAARKDALYTNRHSSMLDMNLNVGRDYLQLRND